MRDEGVISRRQVSSRVTRARRDATMLGVYATHIFCSGLITAVQVIGYDDEAPEISATGRRRRELCRMMPRPFDKVSLMGHVADGAISDGRYRRKFQHD